MRPGRPPPDSPGVIMPAPAGHRPTPAITAPASSKGVTIAVISRPISVGIMRPSFMRQPLCGTTPGRSAPAAPAAGRYLAGIIHAPAVPCDREFSPARRRLRPHFSGMRLLARHGRNQLQGIVKIRCYPNPSLHQSGLAPYFRSMGGMERNGTHPNGYYQHVLVI